MIFEGYTATCGTTGMGVGEIFEGHTATCGTTGMGVGGAAGWGVGCETPTNLNTAPPPPKKLNVEGGGVCVCGGR